jgi:hypothetical protein
MMGRMNIFLRMFSVLGIWKPCIEATGLRDLNLPKERFHEAVRKARTPKINDFHHPASSFSNSSAVQMTIILEREDHEHAAGVVSEESFLLHNFLNDRLETTCIFFASKYFNACFFIIRSNLTQPPLVYRSLFSSLPHPRQYYLLLIPLLHPLPLHRKYLLFLCP